MDTSSQEGTTAVRQKVRREFTTNYALSQVVFAPRSRAWPHDRHRCAPIRSIYTVTLRCSVFFARTKPRSGFPTTNGFSNLSTRRPAGPLPSPGHLRSLCGNPFRSCAMRSARRGEAAEVTTVEEARNSGEQPSQRCHSLFSARSPGSATSATLSPYSRPRSGDPPRIL